MKLAITIEVDVDLVAWGDEYGIRGADAVKADVGAYAFESLNLSYAADQQVLTNVNLVKVVEKRSAR